MEYSSASRPVTSKARGVCRYYDQPKGCFAGNKCKFLHGQPIDTSKSGERQLLTPYDKSKRCRYFDAGFCKRGAGCWFLHTTDGREPGTIDEDDEELCSICFDKPHTYGLLDGCSHIFCIDCIRRWRDPNQRQGEFVTHNTKKCPMCRSPSKFITPSSRFYREGTAEKASVVQSYKESMAKVPCRYFQRSLQKNPLRAHCPYGKDCFYQHIMPDGTPYVFQEGISDNRERYRHIFDDIQFFPLPLDFNSMLEPSYINTAYRGASNRPPQYGVDGADFSSTRRSEDVGAEETFESFRLALALLQNVAMNAGGTVGSTFEDDSPGRVLREPLEALADHMLQNMQMNTEGRDYFGGDDDNSVSSSEMGELPGLQSVSDSSEDAEVSESESTSSSRNDPTPMQWLASSGNEELYPEPLVQAQVPAREEETTQTPASPPPFVTDGRGRVVWSSTEDEDKPGDDTTTSEAEGNSRGGILGWFNSLF